jgi:hypothetical protein
MNDHCRFSRPTTRPRQIRCLALLTLSLVGAASKADAHSVVTLSLRSGTLQVDSPVHAVDIREDDPLGNATVWATDNPGFAGNGFSFNDEILFQITGPLKRWDGETWSTTNVGPEFMAFVEPGPFGNHLNVVTIRKDTGFASGYQIAQIGTRGSLHTHFVFILRTTNCVAPAVGTYTFPLNLRSPQYASAPPVPLVFHNGLAESDFYGAVEQLTAALDMRPTLLRNPDGTLALSVFTIQGKTNQLLSAPEPSRPWSNDGALFLGRGGRRKDPVIPTSSQRFNRLTAP